MAGGAPHAILGDPSAHPRGRPVRLRRPPDSSGSPLTPTLVFDRAHARTLLVLMLSSLIPSTTPWRQARKCSADLVRQVRLRETDIAPGRVRVFAAVKQRVVPGMLGAVAVAVDPVDDLGHLGNPIVDRGYPWVGRVLCAGRYVPFVGRQPSARDDGPLARS